MAPRVVAHRGGMDVAAEHTLAAYARALDAGADGLECDVRMTADGHLVCVHDRTVQRTSNGRGVVSTLELADLHALDFSIAHRGWDLDDEREEPDRDATRILTLDRLLGLVRDAGRTVELAIETKHPTRYAGAVERAVVDLLGRYGWARPRRGRPVPVRVMSFSWLSLRRMHRLAPDLPTVVLLDRLPVRLRSGVLPEGVDIAGPRVDLVRRRPEYVERAHRAGHEVHVWTVNDPADLDLCRDLGVDVVITDRPAMAVSRLRRATG